MPMVVTTGLAASPLPLARPLARVLTSGAYPSRPRAGCHWDDGMPSVVMINCVVNLSRASEATLAKASNWEKPLVMPAMRLVERSGTIEWMAAIAFSRPSVVQRVQSTRTWGASRESRARWGGGGRGEVRACGEKPGPRGHHMERASFPRAGKRKGPFPHTLAPSE